MHPHPQTLYRILLLDKLLQTQVQQLHMPLLDKLLQTQFPNLGKHLFMRLRADVVGFADEADFMAVLYHAAKVHGWPKRMKVCARYEIVAAWYPRRWMQNIDSGVASSVGPSLDNIL